MGNRRCAACGGAGKVSLGGCPRRAIPGWAWDVLDAAEYLKKGLPPVAGGMLDQAAALLAAARFVWNQQDRIEAEDSQRQPR